MNLINLKFNIIDFFGIKINWFKYMEDFQICQLFFCQFSKNFLYEKPIKIIIISEIADIHFFVNFCQFDIHFFVNFVNWQKNVCQSFNLSNYYICQKNNLFIIF